MTTVPTVADRTKARRLIEGWKTSGDSLRFKSVSWRRVRAKERTGYAHLGSRVNEGDHGIFSGGAGARYRLHAGDPRSRRAARPPRGGRRRARARHGTRRAADRGSAWRAPRERDRDARRGSDPPRSWSPG